MSSGSISPNKCESASLVSAGLPATSLLTRSVIVAHSGRAAGIVVQDMQPAEMIGGCLNGALEVVGIGDVGRDRDRAVAGEMRALLARRRIDLGDRDPRALAGEQDCRGAADPGARPGD